MIYKKFFFLSLIIIFNHYSIVSNPINSVDDNRFETETQKNIVRHFNNKMNDIKNNIIFDNIDNDIRCHIICEIFLCSLYFILPLITSIFILLKQEGFFNKHKYKISLGIIILIVILNLIVLYKIIPLFFKSDKVKIKNLIGSAVLIGVLFLFFFFFTVFTMIMIINNSKQDGIKSALLVSFFFISFLIICFIYTISIDILSYNNYINNNITIEETNFFYENKILFRSIDNISKITEKFIMLFFIQYILSNIIIILCINRISEHFLVVILICKDIFLLFILNKYSKFYKFKNNNLWIYFYFITYIILFYILYNYKQQDYIGLVNMITLLLTFFVGIINCFIQNNKILNKKIKQEKIKINIPLII